MKISGVCISNSSNIIKKVGMAAASLGILLSTPCSCAENSREQKYDTIIVERYNTQVTNDKVLKSTEKVYDTLILSSLSKPDKIVPVKSFQERIVELIKDSSNYNKQQSQKTKKNEVIITPQGVSVTEGVSFPTNEIIIAGKLEKARVVVDLSKNVLYYYDNNGNPYFAYSVASGKSGSSTGTGIRKVTHIETYPYLNAPLSTKRRRNPGAYGPNIICLTVVDPLTGESLGANGEFIHGNNNKASLGKYVSKGCIRMDNEVIKYLSAEVKRDDYIVFKK